MTLMAGIFSRNNRPIPDSACASLAQSISRNVTDEVESFRAPSIYFAKINVGAFGESGAYVDSTGALSLLAGEALLSGSNSSRLQDLITIHRQCLENRWDALRAAEGTFCAVNYQPQSGKLTLIADKLGIRPLYFWMDDDLVVFASALRILEELPLVPKKMDLRAVTEMVGLGAPLADRTPYAGIFLLKAAEILQVSKEKNSRNCYWRWDELEVSRESEEDRLNAVYHRFQSAVTRRIGNDGETAAYLSGGLDSRCVVAALRQTGVRVHTVNFARPGTQDYQFGNQFAEQTGSIHRSLPRELGDNVPDYSLLMARARDESAKAGNWPATRPQIVWSGEGGSVLLGHVHLSEPIVELMRARNADGTIEEYLQREQIHIPSKLFKPQVLGNVRDVLKQGIREELDQLHAEDAGRNFYLFLVHNDQRRKLINHFENIDLHRLEFQLPFFDSGFISSVVTTPLDLCMKHKFYVKWLSLFPPAVTAVPWQAYPGHQPCPLPVSSELNYQWDDSYQAIEDASQQRRIKKQAFALVRAADFPSSILSRRNLRLAAWVHSVGWRNYRYAFVAAQTYYDYAKKCGGEFNLSFR